MDLGSWIIDRGSWILDHGSWSKDLLTWRLSALKLQSSEVPTGVQTSGSWAVEASTKKSVEEQKSRIESMHGIEHYNNALN